jgi:hypothetical protein
VVQYEVANGDATRCDPGELLHATTNNDMDKFIERLSSDDPYQECGVDLSYLEQCYRTLRAK